ncbi:MAG: hypothetical protein AB8B96_05755 [Lysobacterales bacterium]
MTHFEYIAVMVSIIMGLGIVRLLSNLDKVFSAQRYWPHAVWVLSLFWLHVQNWWAFWEMRTVAFNVVLYSVWIAYASLLYLCTVALTNREDTDKTWKAHFFLQRRWFFSVMILTIVAAIFITKIFFGASLLHPYRIIQFSLLGLAILAAVNDRERIQKIVCVVFFILMALGISVFRYLPDMFQQASIADVRPATNDQADRKIAEPSSASSFVTPAEDLLAAGLPITISKSEQSRIETARLQLNKSGFAESPEPKSLAKRHNDYVRKQLMGNNNRNVFLVKDFDFSDSDAGLVDSKLLNANSESYVTVEQSALLRTYTNTKVGNLYIRESRNTKVGVIGDVAQPKLRVAGFGGHITKVRYRDGDFATLIMIPVGDKRAKFIEISGAGIVKAQLSREAREFLTTLLTEDET